MKIDAAKFKGFFFVLLTVFVFIIAASGYLYRQNKSYQYQNQRLIIVNDSILSENIELKNLLKEKSSTVLKASSEKSK